MLFCSPVYIYHFERIYNLHLHVSFVNDMPKCMQSHVSKMENVEASNLTLYRERSYYKIAINEIGISVIITCSADSLSHVSFSALTL
jgi:hypothetical protein